MKAFKIFVIFILICTMFFTENTNEVLSQNSDSTLLLSNSFETKTELEDKEIVIAIITLVVVVLIIILIVDFLIEDEENKGEVGDTNWK